MKKILFFILFLGIAAIVFSQTVKYNAVFTWTPNPANELVTGYRIEYQKLPIITNWTYSHFVPSTTNSTVVSNLTPGYTYKFRAFAVNVIGTGTNQSRIIQIPNDKPSAVSNFNNISQ